jgi:glycosyltransferase involved in cell wall biosynthesis
VGLKIKILVFNWRDTKNPDCGGAEVYTHQIMKRLISKGHSVTQVSALFPGGRSEEEIDGVNLVRIGGKYSVYRQARHFYRRNRGKFDIVVDEINTMPFHTGRYVKDVPIVALVHQLAREFWYYEMPYPIALIGNRVLEDYWLHRYCDITTITVSASTKNDLSLLGFKDIRLVCNGLNTGTVKRPVEKATAPTIVFVGRMKKAKRPEDALAAFEIVKRKIPGVKLFLMGDGYLRKDLQEKHPDATFLGYVDARIKEEQVGNAWVIAVPGIREGWGQVVTDANAMGTPAVGYDVPGLRDSIKDGCNGLLVEPNPQALAEGLLKVIEDNNLRDRMSHNALEWSSQFDWDKSAGEFETILQEVISNYKGLGRGHSAL